jgi:Fur family ferric uptake transcriptional regulator
MSGQEPLNLTGRPVCLQQPLPRFGAHYDEGVTLSPSAPAAHFSDLDGALAALRAQGLRVSMVRRLILQALFAAAGPLSVEAIVRAAGEHASTLDAASVYRNLEAFEQAGIIRHVHLGHGPGLYALVGEGEREYLYCESCGAALAVASAELDDVRTLVQKRFGYSPRFAHFPIVGLCASCTAASPLDA